MLTAVLTVVLAGCSKGEAESPPQQMAMPVIIQKPELMKVDDTIAAVGTVEANESLGFKADLRDYGIGAQILLDLGIQTIRILTNNPRKIVGLDGYDLKVTGREPLAVEPGTHNEKYLATKRAKLGHIL